LGRSPVFHTRYIIKLKRIMANSDETRRKVLFNKFILTNLDKLEQYFSRGVLSVDA